MPGVAALPSSAQGSDNRDARSRSELSRRRLLGGAFAAAVLPVLASGCSGEKASSGKVTRTVTDLSGHTVKLSGAVRRVVTIPIPAASMMIAVHGGPEVLVGMNSDSMSAIKDSYLGEVYPELLSVSTDVAGSEFTPSVESILELHPDVVIQWGDRSGGIVEPLVNAGLQVAQLTYGTQKELEQAVTLYGELLGQQDRSQRIVKGMRDRLHQLRTTVPDLGKSRPSVLYLRGQSDELEVAGKASYNHSVTELAGGKNPAASLNTSTATINTEQLLRWDPDIILLGNFGSDTPSRWFSDSTLASLRAVRERRVFKVPLGGYRWDPPSQESPLMWQWLTGVVHETGAPGLRSEIVRQYQFLYDSEPSDSQLESILRVSDNAESRGYDKFGH